MEEDRQQTVTLAVEGMHCGGCAEKLERRLGKLTGVREAMVSFAERQARIVYDPRDSEEARLVAEIQKSGFRVTGRNPDAPGTGTRRAAVFVDRTGAARGGWKSTLLSIPAILASVIPSMTCPLCVTAYTALLSTLGLGFLMSSTYLLPLTVAMLAVAVGALGFEGAKRRNWGPFALSLFGSALILVGKFLFVSAPATYAGVASLLVASI